jgi:hypothetical protein
VKPSDHTPLNWHQSYLILSLIIAKHLKYTTLELVFMQPLGVLVMFRNAYVEFCKPPGHRCFSSEGSDVHSKEFSGTNEDVPQTTQITRCWGYFLLLVRG